MHLKSLVAAAAIALAGCATTKPFDGYFGTPELREQAGTIVFYRKAQFFGDGFRPDLAVDGKVVGPSSPGKQFKLTLAPGRHKIALADSRNPELSGMDIVVKPRETHYVKTWAGATSWIGGIAMEEVPADRAKSELAGLEALN